MDRIEIIQKELVDDFSFMEDWEDKYTYLIELGNSLEELDSEHKTEENRVKGCQSRVWLTGKEEAGRLYLKADSDAIITKGLVAMLIKIFSGQKKEEILKADLSFLSLIGLDKHLSPSRANGLHSMIKKIKTKAAN